MRCGVLQLAVVMARQLTVFMQILVEILGIRIQYINVAIPQKTITKGPGGQRVKVAWVGIGRCDFHSSVANRQQVNGL